MQFKGLHRVGLGGGGLFLALVLMLAALAACGGGREARPAAGPPATAPAVAAPGLELPGLPNLPTALPEVPELPGLPGPGEATVAAALEQAAEQAATAEEEALSAVEGLLDSIPEGTESTAEPGMDSGAELDLTPPLGGDPAQDWAWSELSLPGAEAEAFRFRFGVETFLVPAGATDAELQELVSGPEAAEGRFFGFATTGKHLSPMDFVCRQTAFFSAFELPAARLISRSERDPQGPGLWLDAEGTGTAVAVERGAPEVQEILQGCYASSEFWAGLELQGDPEGPPPVLVVKNQVPALKYDLLVGEPEGRLAELLNPEGGVGEVVWAAVSAELWRAEPGGWPLALRILLRSAEGSDLSDLQFLDPREWEEEMGGSEEGSEEDSGAGGDADREAGEAGPAGGGGSGTDNDTALPESYDLVMLVAGEVYDLNAPDLLLEKAAWGVPEVMEDVSDEVREDMERKLRDRLSDLKRKKLPGAGN